MLRGRSEVFLARLSRRVAAALGELRTMTGWPAALRYMISPVRCRRWLVNTLYHQVTRKSKKHTICFLPLSQFEPKLRATQIESISNQWPSSGSRRNLPPRTSIITNERVDRKADEESESGARILSSKVDEDHRRTVHSKCEEAGRRHLWMKVLKRRVQSQHPCLKYELLPYLQLLKAVDCSHYIEYNRTLASRS